ncbi:MAG: type IV secretion system protein, partial [Steroidobacteraceae bacterium]
MNVLRPSWRSAWVLLLLAGAPAAQAQWAVVDVGAIAQLLQQVQVLEQALSTAQGELGQARQAYQGMTGDRGMESLLSGVMRNYLPGSSDDLQALLAGGATSYGALGSAMSAIVARNSVLSG